MSPPFPFSAIVGQDELKDALLLAAVDPSLGGVLVFGDRGTGKSTAVRALAALLPDIKAREGCAFNCDPARPSDICPICGDAPRPGAKAKRPAIVKRRTPVVDLPLGATEDRVCGTLDLEKALTTGEKAFEPGLLARAHRGFLYIDEVNLLEDHLVDLLLDVAASGTNVVEREGLSVRHPARFVLVGSGNPEEGELRPQLLDRFGLSLDVSAPRDIQQRVEVIRRREAYDRNPDGFVGDWAARDAKITARIRKSSAMLARMETPTPVFELAATLCLRLGVDGLRGELTLIRAARARAALAGKREPGTADVVAVAPMALRHRLRRDPLDEAGSAARVERAVDEVSFGVVGHA
jgi:magnesium chelatase subunit I